VEPRIAAKRPAGQHASNCGDRCMSEATRLEAPVPGETSRLPASRVEGHRLSPRLRAPSEVLRVKIHDALLRADAEQYMPGSLRARSSRPAAVALTAGVRE
jgi:hypothetical protein